MRLYALIALFSLITAVSCYGNTANAPSQGDDRGHPVLQLAGNKIEVNHGRPTLRGRNPEAMIQPGQVWRMGANDPTTFSTQGDLKVGDKVITAGNYTLQAKLVEAKKWNLLIQSEAGSTVEVPFTLQTTDKSVEALTITLEKQDKGGRMVLMWGTLSLAVDFQSVPKSASAADNDNWNELTAFHAVMSATFHPMEEGNFKPIRTRAAEMAAKAKQWSDSTPPALYDKAEIKTNVAKLAQESQALSALVAKKASDVQIKESLNALHDRFHEIAGMCNDAKKQSL
jgi:hypothetical protein